MSTTSFDLDALEKDGRPEGLTFSARGRTFTLADPLLIPWTEFETFDWSDNRAVLRRLMSEDDFDAFMALELSTHAMNILSGRIVEHYMSGEASGSPAS